MHHLGIIENSFCIMYRMEILWKTLSAEMHSCESVCTIGTYRNVYTLSMCAFVCVRAFMCVSLSHILT